jgi:hypothetical protein
MTHLADLLRERKESLDVSAAHLRHGCLKTRCFTAHAPLALHACKERRPAARRARDAVGGVRQLDLFRGQLWLQAGKPWSRLRSLGSAVLTSEHRLTMFTRVLWFTVARPVPRSGELDSGLAAQGITQDSRRTLTVS